MYLPPLLSLRFSSLSTGFYLAHVFPPFLPHTIHLCACVLSSTEPWLTQYCRESCESAIAWDHTLPYYSVILKKNSWSQVSAAMPWLFQAFRWWRLCKEMWAQKTTGGIVGGESKGTSPLSSSLSLSSSFFFFALFLRAALPHLNAWNRLRTPKDLFESFSSIIRLNIPIVQIEWNRISPLFWMRAGGC